MSVGWLKVRRTDYETFEKQKIMPKALSLFWDISSDPADSGMLILSQKTSTLQEDPMELQSWTVSWKMKQQTQPPPPPHSPNHGWHRAKAKMHHFPILVWRGGGINFPSISYKHRRQPGEKLNINHSRLRDEIPAPGSSVPRTLVKAKPRWQTSEGQRDL